MVSCIKTQIFTLETKTFKLTKMTRSYNSIQLFSGEFPVMKPGAKFAWISCTTFETPTGEMKGHFIFTNLRTGDLH